MSTIPLSRSPRAALGAQPPVPGSGRAMRPDRSWVSTMQRATKLLLTWHERSRQRRTLQGLSDHLLRDLGLSRADVMAEATKPFWQP